MDFSLKLPLVETKSATSDLPEGKNIRYLELFFEKRTQTLES
jgi:hypothetical protein